jgi:hypothetical protein
MAKRNLRTSTDRFDQYMGVAGHRKQGKNRRHTMRLLAKQDGAFKQHTKPQQKPNGFAD